MEILCVGTKQWLTYRYIPCSSIKNKYNAWRWINPSHCLKYNSNILQEYYYGGWFVPFRYFVLSLRNNDKLRYFGLSRKDEFCGFFFRYFGERSKRRNFASFRFFVYRYFVAKSKRRKTNRCQIATSTRQNEIKKWRKSATIYYNY